ncbi:COG complex component [Russula emetica]|nr:COG complex component [Russula emetica]
MALQNPIATSSTSRDPFELERLADELEAREHSIDAPAHDLPLYPSLAHNNSFFTATTFNVEDFLLSRVHTSLPDLRAELRDYLAVLKEELVQLINDDYEAFISLSTDLRGEGERLERLKLPLGDLKSQILESRQELSLVQDAIQSKLKKRSSLRDEKTYLHLLLKISESVARLESLLLIALPDGPSSPELKTLPLKSLGGVGEDSDDRPRGNRAKHLVRVATEYTQLLYHVSKAQADARSAFVDEIQWRISRIQSTLSSDLDHLFSNTVTALGTGKLAETDKAKHMADLTECLRTYDALQLWRDAEDVLRRDVLREFVKKTIFPGAIQTPHPPFVPQTPVPIREKFSFPDTARTPYAPFTAFSTQTDPFKAALAVAPRLDEAENPLAVLYNGILTFLDRDLKRIMDVAERISARIGREVDGAVERRGFEVLANVIWAEIARALMDELGSALFAAGRPDEFRKNYETTQSFIRSLQYLAPSARASRAMAAHPTFLAFERRWQLPVYFQLRWKDIVTRLEDILSTNKLEPESSLKKGFPFSMSSSAAVWLAMTTCWDRNVYVPQLAHRFWKLMLQILSRYRTWIQNSLPPSPLDHGKPLPANEKQSTPGDTPKIISRSSTPGPQAEGSSSESTAADDTLLRQYAAVIADVKLLESQTWVLWRDEVGPMLASLFNDNVDYIMSDALRASLQNLTSVIPPLSSQLVSILTRRASEALQPVRSMPLQFRAMSNKRPPSEPSFFVAGVLRPVRTFFGVESGIGPGASLKEELMQPYAEEVFEAVVQKYIFYVTAMRKKEESLRKLKKGKKPAFSLFGGTPKEDDGGDEERIRQQMVLDVEAFGKDAETLGVNVQGNASFKSLHEMAIAPLNDGELGKIFLALN